jgi:RHH-type rel operon transcriptional repressor/antitoxin RelB
MCPVYTLARERSAWNAARYKGEDQPTITNSLFHIECFAILVSQSCNEVTLMAVSLRLPQDISDRLDNLAKLTGRSKTYYMLAAIREHLSDLEDLHLAEQRLLKLRAGKSKSLPLAEVIKRYGLDN